MVVSYANTHADVTDHVGFGVDSPLIETFFFSPFFFSFFFFFFFSFKKFWPLFSVRGLFLSVCLRQAGLVPPSFPRSPSPGAGWGVGSGEWVGGEPAEFHFGTPAPRLRVPSPGPRVRSPGAGKKLRLGAQHPPPGAARPEPRTPGAGHSSPTFPPPPRLPKMRSSWDSAAFVIGSGVREGGLGEVGGCGLFLRMGGNQGHGARGGRFFFLRVLITSLDKCEPDRGGGGGKTCLRFPMST